jgi:DNA-binding LacI/PurR family transcriptional regulator
VAATIHDVARAAGVSAATVSHVINGSADRVRIAAATRERVLACAQELGYVADPRVQALRRGHTRTILAAFIARQVPDSFFVDLLHALDSEAASRGRDLHFQLIRPGTAARPGETWDALRAAAKATAGVVLIGSLPPDDASPGQPLPVPVVHIGSGATLPGAAVVRVDNWHAGQVIAEHLLALGHRTTALLGPHTWYAPFIERRDGYLAAFRKCGAPAPLVLSAPHPDAETVARLREAGVSAVACLYDRLALAFLRAARLAGVRIPEDWSLCGFDDMEWSALLSPSLTTVHIPRARMAAAAMERLEALISSAVPKAPGEPLVIVPELVARESTARRG